MWNPAVVQYYLPSPDHKYQNRHIIGGLVLCTWKLGRFTCVHLICTGRQHSIPVLFCNCQSDVVTLLKLRLWAASPKRPTVAFHLDLMEWMRIMFLETQTSLRSMCQMLPWLSSPFLQQMVWSLGDGKSNLRYLN